MKILIVLNICINSLVKMLCNKNFVGTGVTTGNQRTSCFSTGESTNFRN